MDSAVEKFNALVESAFQEFAEWTHAHTQNALVDTAQARFSVMKDPPEIVAGFSAQEWASKAVFSDPRNAFLPMLPSAKNPPLQTYYNDLYSIMFAKRDSQAFDDVNSTLSYTAAKWGIYSDRLFEPFIRFLGYFHQAIADSESSAVSLSRGEMELAVWNRFIQPARLLFEKVMKDEAQFERHACRSVLRGVYLLDRLQKGFLDKAHPGTWHKSFGEWWKTAKDGIDMKSATAARGEPGTKDETALLSFKKLIADQGVEEKSSEKLSLLEFAMGTVHVSEPQHSLEDYLVRDLLKAKAGLDRLRLPESRSSLRQEDKTTIAEQCRAWIKQFQKDLEDFEASGSAMAVEEKKSDEESETESEDEEEDDDSSGKRERDAAEEENIAKRPKVATEGAACYRKVGCDFCGKKKPMGGDYNCKHCGKHHYCSKHCGGKHWKTVHGKVCVPK